MLQLPAQMVLHIYSQERREQVKGAKWELKVKTET